VANHLPNKGEALTSTPRTTREKEKVRDRETQSVGLGVLVQLVKHLFVPEFKPKNCPPKGDGDAMNAKMQ
jgi:hypothetical protein